MFKKMRGEGFDFEGSTKIAPIVKRLKRQQYSTGSDVDRFVDWSVDQ